MLTEEGTQKEELGWARNDKSDIVKVKVKNVAFLLEPNDTLAKLPENLEVKDSAGDTLDRSTAVRLAFVEGTTLILHPEKTQPEAPGDGPPKKRQKLSLLKRTQSQVSKFSYEGFDVNNFCSWRQTSVALVLKHLNQANQLLISSPSLTGKSALCRLVQNHLEIGHHDAYIIDFSTYDPRERGLTKWLQDHQDFETLLKTGPKVFLFDETQRLYAITADQVKTVWEDVLPEAAIKIAGSHNTFWGKVKENLKHGHSFLFFAAYGINIGTHLPTPLDLHSTKKTRFAYFLDDEVEELLENFIERSQLNWIRTSWKNGEVYSVPQFFKDYLQDRTQYHVGYVAAVLGYININYAICRNEDQLQTYLYSNHLFQQLVSLRGSPVKAYFPREKWDILKDFLQDQKETTENKDVIEEMFRAGMLIQEEVDNGFRIKTPCPLAKEILYYRVFEDLRPRKDEIKSLPNFVTNFLRSISFLTLSMTESKAECGVSEAFWQHQLSVVAYKTLDSQTHINVEIGTKKDQGNQDRGRVDFVIVKNGVRKWLIELLIDTQKTVSKGLKNDEEHWKRFQRGGKYYSLVQQGYEYLVIGFQQGIGAKKERTDLPNYWRVYYETTRNDFHVHRVDKEQEILPMSP